jgi:glycosyltransferase involved in cell wall biosynthesis
MIRLLSIQPVAERGGSDQALLRMLRSLPPDEFECHVVVPAEPPLRADFEAAGVTVHIVPMRRISTSHGALQWVGYAFGWPVAVLRLHSLLKKVDAGVVHTNSLNSWYGWAAARMARRPHVWHARELVWQSGVALKLDRFLTRRYAACVVAMSQAIADQLDPANVVVIHESADATEFRPDRAGSFRSSVGIPDDAPLVGTVGRIDTWKGVDVLLDAWPAAKARVPDAHLVVAGGPVADKHDYYTTLEARAAAMPDAHWLGERRDVPDLFADLDVFVLPSTSPEPYGLVAVEALASGAHVVVTDGGGPPEILATSKPGAGRLVPARDAAALAEGIVEELDAALPTSRALRAARLPLRDAVSDQFAPVFRTVVESVAPRG